MTALRCKNQFAIDLLIDKPESPLKGRDARGIHYLNLSNSSSLYCRIWGTNINR